MSASHLRGRTMRDSSKQILTYLAIMYPQKTLHPLPTFHIPQSLLNPIQTMNPPTSLKCTWNTFENWCNVSRTFLKVLLNLQSYHLVSNYQPNLKLIKTYLWKNPVQFLRGGSVRLDDGRRRVCDGGWYQWYQSLGTPESCWSKDTAWLAIMGESYPGRAISIESCWDMGTHWCTGKSQHSWLKMGFLCQEKDAASVVVCYKACLVAQGFLQAPGIDYFDTFAPVAHLSSIWAVLSIAAINNYKIHQIDIKGVYLIGILTSDETIFMRQLPGDKFAWEWSRICDARSSTSIHKLNTKLGL